MARITVEEVAREAGVSRATVYRWFPGGREQIVDEGITWEIGRFLARLGHAVEGAPDVATRIERGLTFARSSLEHHEVLQHVLATEPGSLLPQLQATLPLVLGVIRDHLRPLLEAEGLRPGVDAEEAADHVARMFMSLVSSPGPWDLDDPDQVRAVVRERLLAGVLPPAGG